MLRRSGSSRTYKHNIYLASTLSLVAGVVNITGWMGLGVLTTNVTGHFVFLSEEIMHQNLQIAIGFFLLINAFLFGAFISSVCTEGGRYRTQKHLVSYVLPISLEILILTAVALSDLFIPSIESYKVLLAMLLLFAMGMQNALVTQVSQSVVRTTHLTGIFTDLGIELSQLIYYKKSEHRSVLKRSIFLKLMIISNFFFGGIIGALLYGTYELRTLLLSVFILVAILSYDNITIRRYMKKIRNIRNRS
ncbi:MAG TPA: YoaK family protein [Flavobacteriaceae bacterium]|nr:YoaK family protein [Flavobacteriaceae bacterium]